MGRLLTHLGGLWAFLATEMSFEFLGPVYVGNTVTAEAEIVEVSERGWVLLAGRVVNAEGQEVLRATFRIGRRQVKRNLALTHLMVY